MVDPGDADICLGSVSGAVPGAFAEHALTGQLLLQLPPEASADPGGMAKGAIGSLVRVARGCGAEPGGVVTDHLSALMLPPPDPALGTGEAKLASGRINCHLQLAWGCVL